MRITAALDVQDAAALASLSQRTGVSMAQIVRDAVHRLLDDSTYAQNLAAAHIARFAPPTPEQIARQHRDFPVLERQQHALLERFAATMPGPSDHRR
jgi:hypothetical protein